MLPRIHLVCCLICLVLPVQYAAQSSVQNVAKAVLEVSPKDAQACSYLTFSGTKSVGMEDDELQFFWGFGPTTPIALRTKQLAQLMETATKENSNVMEISPGVLSAAASRVGPILGQSATRLEIRFTVRNALGNSFETMNSAGIVGSTFQAEPVVKPDGERSVKLSFSEPIMLAVHTSEAPFALTCANRDPSVTAGMVTLKWLHREFGGEFQEIPQATANGSGLQDTNRLPNVLQLAPFVFKPATLHQIRAVAAYDTGESLAPRSFVDFHVEVQDWPSIHVSVLGPAIAYTGCAIHLSAEKTWDPAVGDISTAIAQGTTGLIFAWSCVPVEQVGAKNFCEELANFKQENRAKTDGTGASGVNLKMPANVLPLGMYLFSVSVTRDSGHGMPMVVNHGVKVEGGTFTPLTMVHANYSYSGRLSLEAGLADIAAFMPKDNHLGAGCTVPNLHWRWAIMLDGPRPSLQYVLRTETKVLTDSAVYLRSGFGPATSTALQANNVSLQPGLTYYMILLQSSSKDDLDHLANASDTPELAPLLVSKAQLVVAVTAPKFVPDRPPRSGETEVLPGYVGGAIRTPFKIRTFLWQDEQPKSLLYAFYAFPAPTPSTRDRDMQEFISKDVVPGVFFNFDVDGDNLITQVDITVVESLGPQNVFDGPICLDPAHVHYHLDRIPKASNASCVAYEAMKVAMFEYDADADGNINSGELLEYLVATERARIEDLERGMVKVDPNAMPVINWDDPADENYWLKISGRLVRTWSFENEAVIYSPPGRFFAVVRIMDSFGSVTTAKAPEHIVAQSLANLSQEEVDVALAKVDASSDPNEVLEASNAIVATALPNMRETPCSQVELDNNACMGIFGSKVAASILRSLHAVLAYIKRGEEEILKVNLLLKDLVDMATKERNLTVDVTAVFGESTRNFSSVTDDTDIVADPHHTFFHILGFEIPLQISVDVLKVMSRCQQYLLDVGMPPSLSSARVVFESVAGIVGGLQYSKIETNAHVAVVQQVRNVLELFMLSVMPTVRIGGNQEFGVRLLPGLGANVSLAKVAITGVPVTLPGLRIPGQVANQRRLQGTSCQSLEVMKTHWQGLNVNTWAPSGYGVTDLLLPNASIIELALSRCGLPLRLRGLAHKIEIVLPLSPVQNLHPNFTVDYMCAFFDAGLGAWSTAGMSVQGTITNTSTELSCLSDRSSGFFAAVYEVHEVIPLIVNSTSQASPVVESGLSSVALAAIIVTATCFVCCCIGGILMWKKLSRVKPVEEEPSSSEEEFEETKIAEVKKEVFDPNPEFTALKRAAELGNITASELLAYHSDVNGHLHPELIAAIDSFSRKKGKMQALKKARHIDEGNRLAGRLEGLTPAANEELGRSPAQPPAVKVKAKTRAAKVKLADPAQFPGSRNPKMEGQARKKQPKSRSPSPSRRR